MLVAGFEATPLELGTEFSKVGPALAEVDSLAICVAEDEKCTAVTFAFTVAGPERGKGMCP